MGPGDQQHRLSEVEDRASVAHLEDAQQAAGKGLLSMRENKWDRVIGTGALLTSNCVQCIGYLQQFIEGETRVSKKCIYQLVFSGRSAKARSELGARSCVEDAA
ncbi:MAG: hypothetical protein NVS4B1_30550 [Ktedonobacteraceae bacterium]